MPPSTWSILSLNQHLLYDERLLADLKFQFYAPALSVDHTHNSKLSDYASVRTTQQLITAKFEHKQIKWSHENGNGRPGNFKGQKACSRVN